MLAVHDSGRFQCVSVAAWSIALSVNIGAVFYGRWLLIEVGQANGLSADGFGGWFAAYLVGVLSIVAPLCVVGCVCQYVLGCVNGALRRRDAAAVAGDRPTTVAFAPIPSVAAPNHETDSASDASTAVEIVSPPSGPHLYAAS